VVSSDDHKKSIGAAGQLDHIYIWTGAQAGGLGVWTNKQKPRGKKMSSEKSQNVQDVFLNNVRKNKMPVTVFLVNGVKLQGIITWFDNFSVLLRRDAHSQLVYKHAISTVMPAQPVQLFEPVRAAEPEQEPEPASAD
jgi:host factor-I protein